MFHQAPKTPLFVAAIGATFLLTPITRAATWHVSPSGNPEAEGASWQMATTLQHALAESDEGDEIWLREGTYFPSDPPDSNARFEMRGGVALYGGFAGDEAAREARDPAAHVAILSGDFGQDDIWPENPTKISSPPTIVGVNAASLVSSIDETDVTLDGLTITGASRRPAINAAHSTLVLRNLTVRQNSSGVSSAGFWATDCSSIIVENSTFESNYATSRDLDGPAINFDHCGTVVVAECQFRQNFTSERGGAIFARNPVDLCLANSTFDGNRSDDGGGLAIETGNARVIGCHFLDNDGGCSGGGLSASRCQSLRVEFSEFARNGADVGGGAHTSQCSDVVFNRTRFIGNEAGEHSGGGLLIRRSAPQLFDLDFTANDADLFGGGLALEELTGTAVLIGALFSGNDGAIHVRDGGLLTIMNATATGNGAVIPAIVVESADLNLLNTIVWEGEGFEVDVLDGTLTTNHSNVGDFDPRFVAPDIPNRGPDNRWGSEDDVLPDLRLQSTSDSIDAGIAYALMPDTDLQGLSRFLDTAIDHGAYEYHEDPEAFDRDGDGNPDITETIAGTSIHDPSSYFALVPEWQGDRATFSWQAVKGRSYVIECSTDLRHWAPILEHFEKDGNPSMSGSKPLGLAVFLRGNVSVMGVGF